MLQPVRTKYRKAFKGRIHGKATRAVKLNYGQFGLKKYILIESSANKLKPQE